MVIPFASRPLKWRGGRTGASDAYQIVCVVVEGRVPKAEPFRMWKQGLSGAELIDYGSPIAKAKLKAKLPVTLFR